MEYFESEEAFRREVGLYAGPDSFQRECMRVCVEQPAGELTHRQTRCLQNCSRKHGLLQEMLFKVHRVKAAARPLEYYVDPSDFAGMQALTGRTNPNDAIDTVLHTNLNSLRKQAAAFSS